MPDVLMICRDNAAGEFAHLEPFQGRMDWPEISIG